MEYNIPTDVTNNGDSVTTLITGDWRAFALFQADPSEPDFLDKIYEIKWTSPLPGASSYDNTGYSHQNQHSGFFLNYDSTITESVLLAGPTWWWYSTGHLDNQYNWASYYPNGIYVDASRSYRTSFIATIQFTSDNTWTYKTDVSGTMETYTYTTSYNFSSKTSVDLCFHMSTHSSVPNNMNVCWK